CDGTNPDCPADALRPTSFTCRASAGVCDVADNCDGANAACPADAKSTAVCRAAAGGCDVAESCDGVADACPADVLVSSGTTCRAAAGSCDVAEACTGLLASCPPDVFVPNSTPCNDGNVCTTPDTCQAGACVGTPAPTSCADHFLCYLTRGSFAGTATLQDQFETAVASLVRARHLCTPAEKNGEPVLDTNIHLKSYMIRQTPTHVRQTNLLITNQFGQIRVNTIKPDLLFVPANKSLVSQPPAPVNTAHNVD